MAAAGLTPDGVVRWGELINSDEPGIYVVSRLSDIGVVGCDPQPAPIDLDAVSRLLDVRPELTVDGIRPSPPELARRLADFWLPDEHILYIGLATDLHDRVNQYYGTPLGARRPHAGGWFLKAIVGLNETFVHWARTYDRVAAEGGAIGAFVGSVSEETIKGLRDPERPFPFANLEWPAGTRKRHGIKGAKAPRVRAPGTESAARRWQPERHAQRTSATPRARPSGDTAEGSSVTQRVTAKDLAAGRVRIPRAGKRYFPAERGQVRLNLRGVPLVARWDPRMGPPERSGVLSVGNTVLSDAVAADEVLQIRVNGETFELA
jgi:hypothetical protein